MFVFLTTPEGEEIGINATFVDSFKACKWENKGGTIGGTGTELGICDSGAKIVVQEGMAKVAVILQERLARA